METLFVHFSPHGTPLTTFCLLLLFIFFTLPSNKLSSTLICSSIDSNDPSPWAWRQALCAWSRGTPRCWSWVCMMMDHSRSNTSHLKDSTKWPFLLTAIWVRPLFITSHHIHYAQTFPLNESSFHLKEHGFFLVVINTPILRHSVVFLSAPGVCTCVFGF